MKTLELYLRILKKIRYGKLSEKQLNLRDYSQDSREYDFIAQYNESMNLLSDLIALMEEELQGSDL